jgi:hypothetical protein
MSNDKSKVLASALLFGVASAILYALLLGYSDLFVEWAQRTHQGEKSLFLIPIAVAFVFSWVHGNFTGHFWESLGLKAAKGSESKKK